MRTARMPKARCRAMAKIETVFPGIFLCGGTLCTRNSVRGKRVYGERLLEGGDGNEYRIWDLFRSKLAGAIRKGLKEVGIAPGKSVLYLGASTGTTVSHVSDIVGCDGGEGGVVAVEFAQRSMRDLLNTCAERENVVPIMADARKPEEYAKEIKSICGGKVDVIYQDVAQPDQAQIFLKNASMFLSDGGIGMICIKSQSIDVTKRPGEVYKMTIDELEKGGFSTLQTIELAPYDKDHLFWMGRKN